MSDLAPTCHITQYLEHWKDHVDHRMLPIHDINNAIERALDRQIAHDHPTS
jgi:hypothetical protein